MLANIAKRFKLVPLPIPVAKAILSNLRTSSVTAAYPEDTIEDVISLIRTHNFSGLPVLESKTLIASISLLDIAEYMLDKKCLC